jgi:hypothetical protein
MIALNSARFVCVFYTSFRVFRARIFLRFLRIGGVGCRPILESIAAPGDDDLGMVLKEPGARSSSRLAWPVVAAEQG